MIITLPISGFVSVVGLAVFWLSGDGAQLAPGLLLGLIQFALFLLGKLLVRDEFFYHANLPMVSEIIIA